LAAAGASDGQLTALARLTPSDTRRTLTSRARPQRACDPGVESSVVCISRELLQVFEGSVRCIFWLLLLASFLAAAGPSSAQPAEPTDASLRLYAVHVGDLYGVYLGNGGIITAAHVVSSNPHVRVAGLDLPARVVKFSPFEEIDLAFLAIDDQRLPVSLRLRRMPLCQGQPSVGSAVIVAIPEGTARSQILSPNALPPNARARFSTVISHVNTTGNSGSGVFDARTKCLLGIMSRKIIQSSPSGENSMDIAKYFVPAVTIRGFIPPEYRF
jgi:hypothetical protein